MTVLAELLVFFTLVAFILACFYQAIWSELEFFRYYEDRPWKMSLYRFIYRWRFVTSILVGAGIVLAYLL